MKKNYFLFLLLASFYFTASAQLEYKDVAGIFYNRCTSCHHTNGGAPFSMMTYTQTYPWTSLIQTDLTTGKMPPWPPDTTYSRFLHERIITQTEKNAILSWIASGAQKGDTTLAPAPPAYTKFKLNGTPDLVLKIPTFTSNATSNDAYNCFALPTGLAADRIIRAFEIVPGNPDIVHHVVAKVDTTGTVTNDLSGGCFTEPGDFGIGGYAPGTPPTIFPGQAPLKMGIRIKAGSKIIMQIHYPAGSGGQKDSTQIRLYFYPTGATGIRNTHVATLLQNWGLYIPANSTVSFPAQFPAVGIPAAVSVYAVNPHCHMLCKTITNYAVNGASQIPLIRINNWDFDWQGFYTFPKLVKVPVGYKLYATHLYDNTTNNPNNPNNPPQAVSAGTSTTDEMLFDSFQWLDYQAGDENIDIGSLFNGDSLLSSVNESHSSPEVISSYIYPNPLDESATLIVTNQRTTDCSLKIFDICGKEAAMQVVRNSDSFIIHRNNAPDGVYFYSLSAGKFTGSGKIILMPR